MSETTNTPETQRIAEDIRTARRARGWTQRELADRTGLSLRMIQSAEAGTSRPQPANLHLIRRELDLDAEAEETREAWSSDVHVVVDIVGHMLTTFPPDERDEVVQDLVKWLMERARGRQQQ